LNRRDASLVSEKRDMTLRMFQSRAIDQKSSDILESLSLFAFVPFFVSLDGRS
jgi:hypothetical protein